MESLISWSCNLAVGELSEADAHVHVTPFPPLIWDLWDAPNANVGYISLTDLQQDDPLSTFLLG